MNVYSIGFWGVPNIGDELICQVVNDLVNRVYLKGGDIHYVVTMNKWVTTEYISLNNAEIISGMYPKPEYFNSFKQRVGAIKRSDIITLGGGGVISDKYSREAIPRYFVDLLLALLFRKRIFFVGVGVLHLKSRLYRLLTKYIAKRVTLLYLRDQNSLYNLNKNCNYNFSDKAVILSDLSVVHEIENKFVECNEKTLLINIRSKPYLNQKSIINILNVFASYNVTFLCAENGDKEYYQELISSYEGDLKFSIVNPTSLNECVQLLNKHEYIFAERLHVIAIASKLKSKCCFLVYEDKVRSFLDESCLYYSSIGVNDFNSNESCIDINSFKTADNKGNSREKICKIVDVLTEKAEQDFSEKEKISTSILSFFILVPFLVLGYFYSCLIKVKRKLFGRGSISFFDKNKAKR